MKVIRSFSNNALLAMLDTGRQVIIMGSGVGFNTRNGDNVNTSRIEKIFYLYDKDCSQYEQLFQNIPIEFFEVADNIVTLAKRELACNLNDQVILDLADHIYFSIERFKKNMYTPNLMLDEIKMLYQNEFKVCEKALDVINDYFSISLPKDDIGFLTLHIVNNKIGSNEENPKLVLSFVKGIISIVKEYYPKEFNENDFYERRLAMHLKCLSLRIINQEILNSQDMLEIFNLLSSKNGKLARCLNKICDFVDRKFKYQLSIEEQTYLLMHLLRIINK